MKLKDDFLGTIIPRVHRPWHPLSNGILHVYDWTIGIVALSRPQSTAPSMPQLTICPSIIICWRYSYYYSSLKKLLQSLLIPNTRLAIFDSVFRQVSLRYLDFPNLVTLFPKSNFVKPFLVTEFLGSKYQYQTDLQSIGAKPKHRNLLWASV